MCLTCYLYIIICIMVIHLILEMNVCMAEITCMVVVFGLDFD